ncbi:inactive serine protease scarface-like [Bradysia coprophila]|uniref:inactive serine protease scarface-like n=1 Tax=Bradysia coprophila TaxID=38358 RepID=UPI00187DA5BB|nr:inactive serine protease scarface-like [Bradysia coprophila]
MKCLNFSYFFLALLSCATAQVAEQEGLDFVSEAADAAEATIACNGKGKVCVYPSQCDSGFIEGNSLPRSYNYTDLCHATTVCCTIKPWDSEYADECAIRSLNTSPQGPTPLNANFAEFPWQAMILRESTKSLLCGGVIIKKNFVLTSADCVAEQKSIDVLTKGGEWKLGSDDEGKPFQLVRLKSISLHPDYDHTKLSHNLAVLHLERDYKFDEHIRPLCLDGSDNLPDTGDQKLCIITGWGREALRIHQKDAIEQYTNLTFIPAEDCTRTLGSENFNPDISACAVADSNACNFDFGSALACQREKDSQHFVLKGIYTHNSGCFEPSAYGSEKPTLVFVRPDVKWLNRITKPKWNE